MTPRRSGFTLIEVLIALAIFSVIAILSWRGLDNVFRLTDRLRQVDDSTAEWRGAFGQMASDLRNVPTERQTTSLARTDAPLFAADEQGVQLLIADRQPDQPVRWTQVRWQWANGRWSRWSQGVTTAESEAPSTPVLVTGPATRGLRIRLWTPGKGWTSVQVYGTAPGGIDPAAFSDSGAQQAAGTALDTYDTPTGLEICATLPDGRLYTRIFKIGSAA